MITSKNTIFKAFPLILSATAQSQDIQYWLILWVCAQSLVNIWVFRKKKIVNIWVGVKYSISSRISKAFIIMNGCNV